MDGKFGRRLFLTIEAEGKIHRFFGNAKDLAQHLASIGFTGGAQNVAEGLALNIPCRITTKPSPDGRFQNVAPQGRAARSPVEGRKFTAQSPKGQGQAQET